MYAQILMVYTSLVFNVAVPTSMSARSFFTCMIFSYFESDFRMYLKKKMPLLLGSSEILTISKDKHQGIF